MMSKFQVPSLQRRDPSLDAVTLLKSLEASIRANYSPIQLQRI